MPFRAWDPATPAQEAFSFTMAELIQKKLQGEVEKYQQLQKGKRAELVWSCPCPLSTLMRRRAPSEGRKGGYCVQRIRYPLFLPRNHSPQNCAVLGPFDVSNRVFPLTIPDLSKSMSGRQKLEAQLTENNIVKEVRVGRSLGEGGKGEEGLPWAPLCHTPPHPLFRNWPCWMDPTWSLSFWDPCLSNRSWGRLGPQWERG